MAGEGKLSFPRECLSLVMGKRAFTQASWLEGSCRVVSCRAVRCALRCVVSRLRSFVGRALRVRVRYPSRPAASRLVSPPPAGMTLDVCGVRRPSVKIAAGSRAQSPVLKRESGRGAARAGKWRTGQYRPAAAKRDRPERTSESFKKCLCAHNHSIPSFRFLLPSTLLLPRARGRTNECTHARSHARPGCPSPSFLQAGRSASTASGSDATTTRDFVKPTLSTRVAQRGVAVDRGNGNAGKRLRPGAKTGTTTRM